MLMEDKGVYRTKLEIDPEFLISSDWKNLWKNLFMIVRISNCSMEMFNGKSISTTRSNYVKIACIKAMFHIWISRYFKLLQHPHRCKWILLGVGWGVNAFYVTKTIFLLQSSFSGHSPKEQFQYSQLPIAGKRKLCLLVPEKTKMLQRIQWFGQTHQSVLQKSTSLTKTAHH